MLFTLGHAKNVRDNMLEKVPPHSKRDTVTISRKSRGVMVGWATIMGDRGVGTLMYPYNSLSKCKLEIMRPLQHKKCTGRTSSVAMFKMGGMHIVTGRKKIQKSSGIAPPPDQDQDQFYLTFRSIFN